MSGHPAPPPALTARVLVRRPGFTLDMTLDAQPGSTVAVLGPNGSGKTTLLQTLAGLTPLTDGDLRLRGRAVHDLPPAARRVGLVLAEPFLFPHLSVRRNVAYGPRSRGVRRALADRRAEDELARVGLSEHADRAPGTLSSGQAQRVSLARALATDPDLLLLDEPLSALDPETRSQTRADLHRRLAAYPGVAVVVTHDPLDALTLADHLVFLDDGQVVQHGAPAAVVARPRTSYVAGIVGLTLLRGQVLPGTPVLVRVESGADVVTAEEPQALAGHDEAWVTIDPAAVTLWPQVPHGSPRNTWPVTVTDLTLTGQRARVVLDGPVPLVAEVTAGAVADLGIVRGARLHAGVKATDVRAYPV